MKTKAKFLRYIDEMGGLGLLNYEEHEKIKARINAHGHLSYTSNKRKMKEMS